MKVEINKFFEWAEKSGLKVVDKETKTELKWDKALIDGMEEAKRNKLDGYIKGIAFKYNVMKDDVIMDGNGIIEDFKEGKKNSAGVQVLKFEDADTSGTHWLDTLDDVQTDEIVTKLGMPHQIDENQWEWKVKVGDNVYSIYNWRRRDGEFDSFMESEWFVAGFHGSSKVEIKAIKKYIQTKGTPLITEDKGFANVDNVEVNIDNIL